MSAHGSPPPRPPRPPVHFDQAAAPLGQDASGRYYMVRVVDDPTATRLLKRFDHPGWRGPAARLVLTQRLWRLARLARPELPGLTLEDLLPGEGAAPYACVLDAPPARTLAERLPLAPAELVPLLAQLLDLLWSAHQSRVTGLRFDSAALAQDLQGQWRWLAPDLVPGSLPYEAACREDLQALARFCRSLTAGSEGSAGDDLLASLHASLSASELGPAAATQQAFVRLGLEPPQPTLPSASPLYGCESELETLGAWLRKCVQERRLHTLWLVGDPGSLQWDLCEAFAAQVRPAGARVLVTRCQAEHTPETFLGEVTAQLASLRDEEAPPATAILQTELQADLPPALARLRLMQAMRTLLAEVATRGPLCLAWPGFDGADGLLTELVTHLREHAEDLPVLLVLGSEVDGQDRGGPHANEEVLELRPLFRAEVERLARAHCPGLALGLAAIDAAWAFSGGQPAQVYRLCLHWLRSGGLRQDAAGAWVPRDEGPRSVPPELMREFLRAFATLGFASPLVTMRALMDLPSTAFFELLETALDGGWLRQEQAWLAFWHPGHARAYRGGSTADGGAEALRWHRRLAAVAELAPAERAYHAAKGGQDAMAAPALLSAGRHLLAQGALEAAARQFQLGLEVAPDDDPCRLDLLEGLAIELLESHEPARALALLVEELGRPLGGRESELPIRGAVSPALELALGRLATLQGRARAMLGDRAGARSAYERALPRLAPDALARRSRVSLALADLAHERGERERAQGLAMAALNLAQQAASDVLEAEALVGVARAGLAGPRTAWPEALKRLQRAIALGEAAGQLEAVAQAHRLAGATERALEHFGAARSHNETLRARLRLLGRADDGVLASLEAGWLALQLGLFETALAEVADFDPEPTDAQRPERWVQATAIRAVASLYVGYLHEPLRLLDQALRTARHLKDEALELMVLRALVTALLFLGKYARAEEVCQAGLGLAATLGDRAAELGLRAELAEVACRMGDAERGLRLFQRVHDEAAELGLDASTARALLGLARVAQERGAALDAHGFAARAHALVDAAGHPLLGTEIALVEGDAELAQDRRAEAAASYERALESTERLGSPHHRALALFGLGQSIGDPQRAGALLARAADQMNIYLEQLSANGRKDFLAATERRRLVDMRATEARPVSARKGITSLPGTRSALLDLLKQGQGSSWGAWQDSLSLLDEIFGLVTSRLPLDDLLVHMNATFIRLGQASRGMVFLVNEDGELKLRDSQVMLESQAVLATSSPIPDVLERVRQAGTTLWVMDTLEDPDFASRPEVLEQGLRGLLVIPLVARMPDSEGIRVLGCLYGDRQAPWQGISEKEVGLLEVMARYISVTLEIGILQDVSSRKTYRLEMMNDLSRALAGTLDLERLLNLALTQIMRVSAGEQGYLFFGEDLACRASLDHEGKVLTEIQVSRSVINRVARDRKPLAILDVGADHDLQQRASLMIRNVKSVMCVPLLLDDRLVGLIYVSSSTANKTFTRTDLDLMAAIASQVALALQSAQAYEIIKELNASLEAKVKARTNELEEAYRELQEAQAQLLETEKLATIGTLAGGVAHELNNPLGAVLTNAQLLMAELDDPDQLDSLHMIEEGARRCKEIVAALLKYSRPPQASHRPVELRQVLAETCSLFERQLQQENITLSTDLGADPTVMGDATELRQVVAHLLLNAIDSIRDAERDGVGRVTVRLARELDGVTLTVIDNGAGMGADVLKRIFDPFYTTKKVGSGTGLGLSVCQRVIDKHGGKIHVSSIPGEGSVFTIALPAA